MSDFPDDHPCFEGKDRDTVRLLRSEIKKVVGKLKDELKGNAALEYTGLRSKLLSLLYKKYFHYIINEFDEEEEIVKPTKTSFKRWVISNDKMTAKGVKTSVKKEYLRHRQFVDCLHTLSTCDV